MKKYKFEIVIETDISKEELDYFKEVVPSWICNDIWNTTDYTATEISSEYEEL